MRSVIEQPIATKNRSTDITIVGLLVLAAVLFGFLLNQNAAIPLVILGAIIFFVLIFKKPSLALVVSLFIMQDFFSLLNSDTFRLPGVFKLRDLVLIALFVPIVGRQFHRGRSANLFSSPVAKAILFFMGSVIFITLYTKFYYGASWNLIIRSGRHFLYYTIFFVTVCYLKTEQNLNNFFKGFFWLMIGFSFLYIIQFLIGEGTHIFPYAVRIVEQKIGSISVVRSYIIGKRIPALLLCCLIGVYLFQKKLGKNPVLLSVGAAIFAIETILTWGRAHWIGTIIGIVIASFLLARGRLKRFLKVSVGLFIIMFLLSFSAGFFNVSQQASPSQLVFGRIQSAYNDFITRSGNYGSRLVLMRDYFSNVISNHIFLGIGFVHPEISEMVSGLPVSTVTDSDLGNFNILIQMGLLGLFSLSVLLIVFFKRAVFIFSKTDNKVYKGIIWGILAFYIGRLFVWSLGTFVYLSDSVPFAISMGIIEAIYQIEHREKARPLNYEK